MDNEQVVEEIELNITAAKEIVAKGETLERLSNNPDFKEIITEGFFKDEAQRLVMMKATPAMQTEKHQADTNRAIDAIGGLYQYFLALQQKANIAFDAIQADEEAISEIAEMERLEAEAAS